MSGNTILESDSLDQAFQKVCAAFDNDEITDDEFINCLVLNNKIKDLTDNIMSPNKSRNSIQKSDPLEILDKMQNDIRKSMDSVQTVLSIVTDPFKSDLLNQARKASENDLRKAMSESKFNEVCNVAWIELRRRGKTN